MLRQAQGFSTSTLPFLCITSNRAGLSLTRQYRLQPAETNTIKQAPFEKQVSSGIRTHNHLLREALGFHTCYYTFGNQSILQSEKNCVSFFTDFSADARSEKCKITLVTTFVDICFSLPRSIPAIAEKLTQKIAGMHSSKFVFYELGSRDFSQYMIKQARF